MTSNRRCPSVFGDVSASSSTKRWNTRLSTPSKIKAQDSLVSELTAPTTFCRMCLPRLATVCLLPD
jgi:hypothetical protein